MSERPWQDQVLDLLMDAWERGATVCTSRSMTVTPAADCLIIQEPDGRTHGYNLGIGGGERLDALLATLPEAVPDGA